MAEPTDHGLTYLTVAALARSHRYSPAIKIAERASPKVSDEVAMGWIRGAQERGYDVGKPRDDGK